MAHVATVTISAAQVSADLTDFPVYIDLSDMPTLFWSTVANGGGDIRCYKSDGTTELPREVVSCDTATDTGKLHVKYSGVLSSSADTEIEIHADGSSAEYAVTAAYGRNAVWSDYAFVSHMETGAASDSSGNETPVVTGAPPNVPGAMGYGIDFQNSAGGTPGDYVRSSIAGPTSGMTLQTWIDLDSTVAGQMLVDLYSSTLGTSGSMHYLQTGFGSPNLRFVVNNDGAAIAAHGSVPSALTMVHGTFDGSNVRLFVDGIQSASTAYSDPVDPVENLSIATNGRQQAQGADGVADEVRVRSTPIDISWANTEHANQRTPLTFYSVSEVSGGGGNTLAVDNLVQSVLLSSTVLSQHHLLSVDSISQGQALTASGLVQRSQLLVDGLSQSQLLAQPNLTQAHILTVDNLSQAQTVQQAALVVSGSLVVQSLAQSQSLDVSSLLQHAVLAVDDLAQSLVLDASTLAVAGVLQVAGLSQSQQASVVSLVQHGQLQVNGLTQAQAFDVVSLAQRVALQVEGLLQSQSLQQTALAAQDVLAVDGLSLAQVVSVPSLAGHSVLAVDSLTQAQIVQVVRFGGAVVGYLEGRLVMYSLVDGEVSISELVEGSLTIN